MKSVLLSCGLLLSQIAFSCQKTENTNEGTTSQTAVSKPKADQIIRDTVTNRDGLQLMMAFNNTNQTDRFFLKGEIIDIKQDPTASGVKYSNSTYEYGEHQGEMTLKKMEKPFLATKDKAKDTGYTKSRSYSGLFTRFG